MEGVKAQTALLPAHLGALGARKPSKRIGTRSMLASEAAFQQDVLGIVGFGGKALAAANKLRGCTFWKGCIAWALSVLSPTDLGVHWKGNLQKSALDSVLIQPHHYHHHHHHHHHHHYHYHHHCHPILTWPTRLAHTRADIAVIACCGKRFSTSANYKKHMYATVGPHNQADASRGQFARCRCTKRCKSQVRPKRHLQRQHRGDANVQEGGSSEPLEGTPCTSCSSSHGAAAKRSCASSPFD